MESSGSDSATDSTDTSTSDSSSDRGSPSAQIIPIANEDNSSTSLNAINEDDKDGENDSASDISMSAETEDEDDETPKSSAIQVNPGMHILERPAALVNEETEEPASGLSNKRKLSEVEGYIPNGHFVNGESPETRKRLKPDYVNERYRTSDGLLHKDKSSLPAEIWHHIFSFIPPRSLGLLLQVNRSFNAYLDSSVSAPPLTPLSRSVLQILKPESIWQASRRLFWFGMPAPLKGKSELDMWKIIRALSCQFCRKKPTYSGVPVDQWHQGPGENGIIPVWSFGVHACGPCIQEHSSKEMDLIMSSTIPSPLMSALPFVLMTNELHIVSLTTFQSGSQPSSISVAKYFFNPPLEDIKLELAHVKDLGPATAEEWLKGLDDRGKELRNDSFRWERWEKTGGVSRVRSAEDHGYTQNTARTEGSALALGQLQHPLPLPPTNGHIQNVAKSATPHLPTPPQALSNISQPIPISIPTSIPARFDSPSQTGFTAYPPRPYLQGRHERSKEEVAELKAARRAEIERRCMLLDPPLTAGVLAHMGSFQAAIQIIQPLNDGAWEVLKPRLLSQREDAEQREKERIAQSRVVLEQITFQETQVKSDTKDPFDRDWDIQAPLRARIGGYADETIRDGWANGTKVSKDNCSSFAAEVLLYVRKRFYAEVAKDDAALRATGREPEMDPPPDGPSSRKLTLENMKWVFDTKIKPHTEEYRKELFLCNDCEVSKSYGFEGVIQHYAAKHTNSLSMGSIVVHWKSEWPEYPPFNPEPAVGKTPSYYTAAPSASVPYPSAGPQQTYGFGGYQPAPVSAPMQNPHPQAYQESPGPYYGHPQFGDQYATHQNGPYAPPQPYQDQSHSYQAPHYSVPPPPPPVSNSGYNDPQQDYSQQSYENQYPPSTQGYYNPPAQTPFYPTSGPDFASQQPSYAPQDGSYNYSYNQTPAPQPTPAAQVPPKTEEYKTQLLDVAKNARDIWDTINGLKEVPGSVKVYTIIYHILRRSRFRFQDDPSLGMIIDGLSSNKDMRKVRNINGLLCKACKLGMPGALSASLIKHMSFPQLVNHFNNAHEQTDHQNGYGHVLDWKTDMVELPEPARLSAIANATGMTDQKLKLIAEALPEIFAAPQDKTEFDSHPVPSNGYEQPAPRDHYDPPPSKDNHDKYYTTVDDYGPQEQFDSTQYDPRNPHDTQNSKVIEEQQSRYKAQHTTEDYYPQTYPDRYGRPYGEHIDVPPATQVRSHDGYSRMAVREEHPLTYLEKQPRYRDERDVEYRTRRGAPNVVYKDLDSPADRDYRDANAINYQSNRRREAVESDTDLAPSRDVRRLPVEDTAEQQSRIYDVVAQISQQAIQAQAKRAIEDPIDGGSEDGELRVLPKRVEQAAEASNAAERFLNDFIPGDEVPSNKIAETEFRPARYESERRDMIRNSYQPYVEHDHRTDKPPHMRVIYGAPEESGPNNYIVRDRASPPRSIRTYAYDDRHMNSAPDQPPTRERSPELVDRRFKLNNVVYRDERQASHAMHRTPSNRYARYESVRLENDRARSRSPVYVKVGAQPHPPPGHRYRERSPGVHHTSHQQEPIYRARTPLLPAEEMAYERAPRQEYYVYADNPPPRQPQYVEAYELVRVSDPQGDYMIRRPVRREAEPVPVYYEDDGYARKPIYESRAPPPSAQRSEAPYYEEYDPRHPAPPTTAATTAAPVRQVRYQQ